MDDIPKNSHHDTKYSGWLDKNFDLYFQGNMTDADMIDLINYLKNKKIIVSNGVNDKYPLHQNVITTYF